MNYITLTEAIQYLQKTRELFPVLADDPLVSKHLLAQLIAGIMNKQGRQEEYENAVHFSTSNGFENKTVNGVKASRRLYNVLMDNLKPQTYLGEMTLPELIGQGLTVAAIRSFRGAGVRTLYELLRWAASENITIPPY